MSDIQAIPSELNKINKPFEEQLLSNIGELHKFLKVYSDKQMNLLLNLSKNSNQQTDIAKETVNTRNEEKKNLLTGLDRITGNLGSGLQKVGTKIKSSLEPLNQTFEKGFNTVFDGLLGPLNLITKPIENFSGKRFADILNPFNKKFKGSLKRNKIKEIDPGAVYLADTLLGNKTKDESKEKFNTFLSKLGITGGLAKALNVGIPLALIAGGLIWMAVDAIKGVFKAKEWNVSKVSAGIGGFLGGTESGLKGAFSNMGKWALLGAGIGFAVGSVPGAIAGGILGAGIGAIIGYIGGARIAKGIDDTKKALDTVWKDGKNNLIQKLVGTASIIIDATITSLTNMWIAIPSIFIDLFVKDKKKADEFKAKASKIIKELINFTPFKFISTQINIFKKDLKKFRDTKNEKTFMKRLGTLGFDLLTNWYRSLFKTLSRSNIIVPFIENFIKQIPNAISGAFDWLGEKFDSFKEKFKEKFPNLSKFMSGIINNIQTNISNIFTSGIDLIKDNPVTNFVEGLIGTVINFFRPMLDYFEYAGNVLREKPILGIGELAKDITTGGKGFSEFQTFKGLQREFTPDVIGRIKSEGSTELKSELAKLESLASTNDTKKATELMIDILSKLDKTIKDNKDRPNVVQSNSFGNKFDATNYKDLEKSIYADWDY